MGEDYFKRRQGLLIAASDPELRNRFLTPLGSAAAHITKKSPAPTAGPPAMWHSTWAAVAAVASTS